MVWDESMSTGVREIDIQHQELLAKFNEFSDALEQGKGREEAGRVLDFLQFYAQWHFQREERCMAETGCPAAEANRSAHQYFLERFGQLYEQYQEHDTDPRVIYQTFIELRTWIIRHIKRLDTQLAPCAALHVAARTAETTA